MATLSLGTPAQNFDAIVDTGSANLVVMGPDCQGCSSVAYRPNASSSADESSSAFEVTYGSASLGAKRVTDLAGLPCGDSVQTEFGLATQVSHLPASILGLGYPSLASPANAPVKPWFDAMVEAGVLEDIFSLRLCGPGRSGSHIKLGGIDASIQPSELSYTSIVQQSFYVISPPEIALQDDKLGDGDATTIVDSGTTLMLVPAAVHQALVSRLQAAADAAGFGSKIPQGVWTTSATDISARATLSPSEIAQLPALMVRLRTQSGDGFFAVKVPPQRYFRRTSSGGVYLGVRPNQGMTILGQVFMEEHDVVFDRANKRIGFATAPQCGD